jgi:hypothetical protein
MDENSEEKENTKISLSDSITLIPQRYYLQKAQVSDKQKSTNTWLCQKIHLP